MSLLRLVLCLTLLGPSLVLAQTPEEWTPYTPPADSGTPPPPLVPATPQPEAPAPSEPPASPPPRDEGIPIRPSSRRSEGSKTALRLISAPWAGTITGMMGLIIGMVPTALVAMPFCLGAKDFDTPGCLITVGTGLSLSYTAGVAVGIAFVGKVMGGRGEVLPTVLGALAGAAMGAGIGVATQSIPGFAIGVGVGPLLGAVLGYEFSHAMASEGDQPDLQARSGFRLMPMAGATPRGGFLGGLTGQF